MEWRTQENASVEELRRAKGCSPTKEGFVRFQALELLYEGYEKAEVARISNRSIRTIERWEAAFDARGIEGVTVKGRAGRPRRVWVKKGQRPRAPYLGDHIRVNVVGAVAPERGDFFSLIVPHSDTEVFQVFLDELARYTKGSSKRIVLVVDNASWHRSASLDWYHIEPRFLPPYSPDLNPIEVVWSVLKQRTFTSWYPKSLNELLERTATGIQALIANPSELSSITSFSL